MDQATVEQLAEEAGIGTLHGPSRLTDMGNGTLKFLLDKRLTYFGESLVRFANLVEERTKQSTEGLHYELDGVIVDYEHNSNFDAVSLATLKRVRDTLV